MLLVVEKAGERGPSAARERHITRVAPPENFFEVLIWALEPGSQRASCRNRKSALFLARNLDFRILKSILGLSAPPAGRRSCEKYIKRPAAAPIFFEQQFLHIDFVHAKA